MDEESRAFFASVARMFGGALLFSIPILMTMEMWWLGFHIDPVRLALLVVLTFPLLMVLSRRIGRRRQQTWVSAAREAVVAYAVGMALSATMLFLFGVFKHDLSENVGKVAVQAVPAALGAIVGSGQFGGGGGGGGGGASDQRRRASYATHAFFMLAGALYLAITVAPTEEMILIAFKMGYWRAIPLALASLAVMYAVLRGVHFRRTHRIPSDVSWWSIFARFTLVGYAIALISSAYVLWTFGRFDGSDVSWFAVESIVLGFPAALGAAGARLLL